MDEGFKMGRFFLKNKIGTSIRSNGVCGSSCAFAFLGGRSLSGHKLYILPKNSRLVFHMFFYYHPERVSKKQYLRDKSKLINYLSWTSTPTFLFNQILNSSPKKPFRAYAENLF